MVWHYAHLITAKEGSNVEALSCVTDYLSLGWTWLSDNVAGVIAALAFFATAYQAWLMRRHNRASLKPHLSTTKETLYSGASLQIIATLHNAGLGPAFIKTFEVLTNNESHAVTEPEQVRRIIEGHLETRLTNSRFYVLRQGAVLRAGDDIQLANIAISITKGEPTAEQLLERLKQIHLLVRYSSAYGEKDIYDSRIHQPQDISPDPQQAS